MSDIVERLRSCGVIPESLGGEAAREIERLLAEQQTLRNAAVVATERAEAECDALLEIIREVANSTVEYEARKYLVVQMDKATMRAAIDAARQSESAGE